MRILFGVQGTGNGHLSRCHTLSRWLNHYSVDVDYLISGRAPSSLFDMSAFGEYQWRQGLSFATQNGRVDYFNTYRQNSFKQFWSDVKALDLSTYDLILTDYEPVSAWAARLAHKPCIGIGRQYAFKEPSLYSKLSLLQRGLIDYFAPASRWLGMHWQPLDNCIPPIVREQQSETELSERHVLVYLPFENLEQVVDALIPLKSYQFSVFHPSIKQTDNLDAPHILGFPPSREGFKCQFETAEYVLANAGFETTCEALQSDKQFAVKPLRGQFEQHWNSKLLADSQLAYVMHEISEDNVRAWLAGHQRAALNCEWPNMADNIAQWIKSGAQENEKTRLTALWG
ncbi:MAG: glycosyl transferase [Idiomarinaceae bacterium]|nr:glycosyl transferase [Idiomarinaceae bacterium]